MPAETAEGAPYARWSDDALAAWYRDAPSDDLFAEIVRRFQHPVFRLAVSVLGQGFAADAEDVAQEVLVRVHLGLPRFRGDAKLGSWIYRITFNLAVSVKARTRFRAPHLGDDVLGETPSLEQGPEARLTTHAQRRAVLESLHDLPEVYQSALRLHYWLDTSVRDIAVLLDVPENTVKSYLFRARQLLRARLTERGIDAPG